MDHTQTSERSENVGAIAVVDDSAGNCRLMQIWLQAAVNELETDADIIICNDLQSIPDNALLVFVRLQLLTSLLSLEKIASLSVNVAVYGGLASGQVYQSATAEESGILSYRNYHLPVIDILPWPAGKDGVERVLRMRAQKPFTTKLTPAPQLLSLVGKASKECERLYENVLSCLDEGNYYCAQEETHSLKGVAYHYGFGTVGQMAEELERRITEQTVSTTILTMLGMEISASIRIAQVL